MDYRKLIVRTELRTPSLQLAYSAMSATGFQRKSSFARRQSLPALEVVASA